jgi:hypothetical protein
LTPILGLQAQASSQGTNYDRTFSDGSLHRIHLLTTTLRVVPITREQRSGFAKEVSSPNGNPMGRFCGSTESVRSPDLSGAAAADSHPLAGSGKSVLWFVAIKNRHPCVIYRRLSSTIIQDIIALRDSGSASMAYFYFDFRDSNKQSRRDLLSSLITQLSSRSDRCFDLLYLLYLDHDNGSRQPSEDALIKCLKEVLTLPDQHPVYLIIDALDECPNTSGMPSPRERVLELLKELIELSSPNLRLCVTSRAEIDIRNALQPLTYRRVSLHEQSGQKQDIIEYITSVVQSDPKIRRWREDDKNLVIETLSERADGM